MDGAPDPDWYFDNVLSDASSDGPVKVPRGSRWAWVRSWQGQYRVLGASPAGLAARAQGFVLTRAGARACGLRSADIRRLVARREWCAPSYGVVSPVALPPPGGALASVLLAERHAHALRASAAVLIRRGQVVTGRSAAVLHGLPTLAVPTAVELTAAAPTTPGRHGRALVRSAGLDQDEISSWFGAPVSAVARTVVDIARHDRRDGLVAADAALHEGVLSSDAIAVALRRQRGWPGTRSALAVLDLASALAESPLESLVRLALHDDGFPAPELQVGIGDDRVDFLWPRQRVVLEADGRSKYTGAELWREKQRERRLTERGYLVVRVFWSDVMSGWAPMSAYLWSVLASSPH